MQFQYVDNEKSCKKILRPSSSFNSINFKGRKLSKLSQINGKPKPSSKPIKEQIVLKQKYIREELRQQILLIQKCLSDYSPFLKHIEQKQSNQTIKQQIFSLQDLIKSKDEQISIVNSQILNLKQTNLPIRDNKILKNNQYYQPRRSSKRQIQGSQYFKLTQQLKQQRQLLQKLQSQHSQKRQKLIQISSAVHQIQLKFTQKSKNNKKKLLTYQEFKQLNTSKKNSIQQNKNKKKTSKQKSKSRQSSINKNDPKPFIFSIQPIREPIQSQNNTNKSLKDFQKRKAIAQQALRNSRRKHNSEIKQLMEKIQFLRDEEMLLNDTIKQKQQEKLMLDARFQGRGRSSSSTSRFMSGGKLRSSSNGISREDRMKSSANLKSIKLLSSPSSNESIKLRTVSGLHTRHHYSSHRKLISAKQSTQPLQTDNDSHDPEHNLQQKLSKNIASSFNYDNSQNKYIDNTFNPHSKNSFKQPSSTNFNQSNGENEYE